MVKVNYASLQTQSSTMSSVSQSRVAGFNQLLSAFNSFGDSGNELIGTGYDAARVYATSVMSPYYKGFILYSEAVADAANTLADNYVAKCGAENLDEEQLQAEIDSATRGCMSLSASISGLQSKAKPAAGDAARISRLQEQLTAAQSQLNAAQEKLDNLRAFSAESLLACASADTYQLLIYQAMSGISTSFGGGSFALPQDLSWVGDIEQGWADREIAMENNYLSALEKVNNGESLTEAELTAIERYAAAYPERVDDSVIQYVQQARQVKAEEMKYRSIIDKVDAGKELSDSDTKFIEEYKKKHPNVRINPAVEKIITIQKNPDEIFKKNLQEQYGFDKETTKILLKLYNNIREKEGNNADYVFNRLVGGVVYDTTYKDAFMWANTAGVGGEAGHHGSLGILDQLEKEYGLTSAEFKKLSKAIGEQHKNSNENGVSDFAHQSITTATSLYRVGHLRSANIIAFQNSHKNTTVPWYERIPKAVSKLFGAKEYTDELAGWRGDATGEALKKPTMGNDDYKADLDSVNIVSLMKKKDVDYATAVNQYYKDIREGEYTRARAFVENSGGRDRILKELLDAELIEEDNLKSALKELREKNPVAYDFYNSLTADNGKGSNDLITEGVN